MANELFKKVTENTGLPSELVAGELTKLLGKRGLDEGSVTLEDLRSVLSEYLRDVIVHAKDTFDKGVQIEEEILPEDLGQ